MAGRHRLGARRRVVAIVIRLVVVFDGLALDYLRFGHVQDMRFRALVLIGFGAMVLGEGIVAYGLGVLGIFFRFGDFLHAAFGVLFAALAAAAASVAIPSAAAAAAVALTLFVLVLGLAGVLFLFGLEQRHAVGEGDLVVVGVDFREGEEAMAVAAILHEGRLQRRLDARHLGEIDVTLQLPACGAFEIEFLDAVALDDHNAGLFGVAGIDEHLAAHESRPLRQHGKFADRFSAPVRIRLWELRVLQREWGMRVQPADTGKQATGAGLARSSFSALVVAWDMPRISLCSSSRNGSKWRIQQRIALFCRVERGWQQLPPDPRFSRNSRPGVDSAAESRP